MQVSNKISTALKSPSKISNKKKKPVLPFSLQNRCSTFLEGSLGPPWPQKFVWKPPETLPKPQKSKNKTFNSTAGFDSKFVMVRALAAPKDPPGPKKKVDTLSWEGPWTHRTRKHPQKERYQSSMFRNVRKNVVFENHQNQVLGRLWVDLNSRFESCMKNFV